MALGTGDENIDHMVTCGGLESRERRTRRAGLDGHGGQPAGYCLSEVRRAVQFAPQHLLANTSGSVRSRRAGHCERPPRALEVRWSPTAGAVTIVGFSSVFGSATGAAETLASSERRHLVRSRSRWEKLPV